MLSFQELQHLAKLARLGLPTKEPQKLQKDLESILAYVEKLGEADVSGIKPISHITGLENVGREDDARETLAGADEVLKAVPQREGRWVKVPLIIKSKIQSSNVKSNPND
ncbi:MAG: Asp-tRNA(Asn)/Glu-tRNA(Gln) amidotransferase subunit GatC [Candidatus Portnoybacteria bacterium]|nr:Asp-tRNA(Asn)/Glu-tRNA(Gln) amidotransferase subunit GatC [Candidatus Portnoybacteria bacterium]